MSLALMTWSICRDRTERPRWRWLWLIPLAASTLSRSVGVGYSLLAIIAAVWSAQLRLRDVARLFGGRVLGCAGVVVVAGVVWDPLFKSNIAPTVSVFDGSAFVADAYTVWSATLRSANTLGYLDTTLPTVVATGWLLYCLWWLFTSVAVGSRHWLRQLTCIVVAAFVIGVAIARGLQPTGFGMQARFLLPGFGAVVLSTALHIATQSPRRRAVVRPRFTLIAWGLLVSITCYALLRRHVVGARGPIWFFDVAGFRPLGGWLLLAVTWILFAVALVAVTAHFGRLASLDRPDRVATVVVDEPASPSQWRVT